MGRYYITTAIDYPNSLPHLGTAYEKIGADVIARYRRMCGDDVVFLMGNDEHSQNVRKRAEELGEEPKAYCDRMSAEFQAAWKALHISYDSFIQTTSPEHHATVREIANRIFAARDDAGNPVIFKGSYEGHYCVSCEAFYQEKDLADGKCPNHKIPPQWIREENYFFRLSAYAKPLRELFDKNPSFLRPLPRRNEVLQVLEQGLEDISISRPNRGWGVTLPFDTSAVAYVWFDALTNYISALGPFDGERHKKYWPANLHVIGKDITRFHCLIWPAMLMAAKLPLPIQVWAHGFVSIGGEKMSKSRGNVADPRTLTEKYGADVLRYHLMREVPWDRDGDFTEDRLTARYNADLANDLGNLVSRTVTMVRKSFGDDFARPASIDSAEIETIRKTISRYHEKMGSLAIDQALAETWTLISEANLLIDRTQPWAMAKDPAKKEALASLFYVLLERLRHSAMALYPVMPEKMLILLHGLGVALEGELSLWTNAAPPGDQKTFQLAPPQPLFPRLTL